MSKHAKRSSYYNNYARERRIKQKEYVLQQYGNRCRCCHETRYEFLSIEHIGGGGHKHRTELLTNNIYRFLILNDCPKDKYEILCYNCNMAKAFFGYCPHEEEDILRYRTAKRNNRIKTN